MLLSELLIKMVIYFLLCLTNASALPGETGTPKIMTFHLNTILPCQQTHIVETQSDYHVATAEPRGGSRILQGRVSNPSERGTGGRAPKVEHFPGILYFQI